MQIVETDRFLSATPVISWEEHQRASEEFRKTGCVPLDYAAKMSRGYFVLKVGA